jgi:hypothetical protein
MGSITELVWVNNYSPSTLTLTNLEPEPDYVRSCPPGSTYVSYTRVPWCDKGSLFSTHHIVITLNGATFFVWQQWDTDDNWVRLSTTGFISTDVPPFNPAPRFPGTSFKGGDRNIQVAPDGALSLREATP